MVGYEPGTGSLSDIILIALHPVLDNGQLSLDYPAQQPIQYGIRFIFAVR